MMAGFVVLLVAVIANLFLHIPALSLAISVMFILFSSGAILWETSNIITWRRDKLYPRHRQPLRIAVQYLRQPAEYLRRHAQQLISRLNHSPPVAALVRPQAVWGVF